MAGSICLDQTTIASNILEQVDDHCRSKLRNFPAEARNELIRSNAKRQSGDPDPARHVTLIQSHLS